MEACNKGGALEKEEFDLLCDTSWAIGESEQGPELEVLGTEGQSSDSRGIALVVL